MTAKLIVGYRTQLTADADKLKPVFQAPAHYKDPEAIAKAVAELEARWLTEAKDMPYTGTFDFVFIADPRNERVGTWTYKDREPGGKKPPICQAVRNWILKGYPNAWEDDTNPVPRPPAVIFLGFEPRNFLKMLGIECSLPEHHCPLPAAMWYGNTDHRDIGEACMPREFSRFLNWPLVFNRRGITPKEGWAGPGQDPAEDVRLIVELAAQLGFLKDKV